MDGLAGALQRVAQTSPAGDSGTWYHKNDSGMTVYFFWGIADVAGQEFAGSMNDIENATITLPRMSGITGLEPGDGDVLVDSSSRAWRVLTINLLGLPTNPAAWTLGLQREPEFNRTHG